jgi:protein-tyrosine phosphatase
VIDLHCHILPGLDDGAGSMEESLSMARTALEDGIKTVVATPHTLDGLHINPLEQVTRAAVVLREALAGQGIALEICVGADVHLCPGMAERIGKGDAATINNTGKYLLLELPPQTIPERLRNEIFSLKLLGITPIITHPERHPVMQRDPGALRDLISLGSLAQVTAMSLTGEFGGTVMSCVERMVRDRLVHVIATDAHSAESRPPLLSRAVEAAEAILGNPDEAKRMVTELPAAILAGDPVEVPAPARVKKSRSFGIGPW